MRTVAALHSSVPTHGFGSDLQGVHGQIPLPFPGLRPVLPVPVEHGEADARPLRERAARFMQALVEVLSGDRPVRQMGAWMAPDVYEQLNRRLSARARAPRNVGARSGARIASVHIAMVHQRAAEIAGRMVHRGRSRAIAVRLELQTTHRGDQVWRCTALVWA